MHPPNLLSISAFCIAAVLAIPTLVVLRYVFHPATEVWEHLAATVLQDYVLNSLVLMGGVALGTTLLGVPTAWLVAMCRFPGRNFFNWALLLPLAFPAYIIAYTYTGMLEFAGPLQSGLREITGWEYGDYWFPDVRSMGGAILMLSLVLYPYVYLLARAAFLEQSACALEVSRTLGCSAWHSFQRVALPLARPAVVAGLSLALMETLADYGTVELFGISTFTTGIFRTWFGLGDAPAAAQLAAILVSFVCVLVVLERWSRRRLRFHHTSTQYRHLPEYALAGAPLIGAFIVCLLPLLFGFIVPAAQLLSWALATWREMLDETFWLLARNTFLLAAAAAGIAVSLGLIIAYALRLSAHPTLRIAGRVAALGYAIPGTVVAVGVLIPFGWLDNTLDGWSRREFGFSTGLLFSGTLFILLFAYTVRFLAVALQTHEAGLSKIKREIDDAARSLGRNTWQVILQVHTPLMRASVLTAATLVFVDVLKELPATYILRPFNFNTLAVRAFELAGDERLADSSTAALAIVAVGVLPVVLLSRTILRSRPGTNR